MKSIACLIFICFTFLNAEEVSNIDFVKENEKLYLKIVRSDSKSAAIQLFIRDKNYLELAYYTSQSSEMRRYCLSLIFINKNIDLLDVPYNKYNEYNDRLSVERSKEYNEDLDSALMNVCSVSRDILKYVENKKFEFLAKDKLESYLGYAEYYAKYDRVVRIIVDGNVRISLVSSLPEK